MNEFSDFINEHSSGVENIDCEYIKSEQFIDVFHEIISHIIRINSEKKLQHYNNILVKSISQKNRVYKMTLATVYNVQLLIDSERNDNSLKFFSEKTVVIERLQA